jgi:ABC-2 type transport system permease protein
MNGTIALITLRAMLGRRRAWLLFLMPLVMLLMAALLRAMDEGDLDTTTAVLRGFGISTLLPLLCLIAGTGVIGPEIDDGQLMYLLTKPIPRPVITTTKLAIAFLLMAVFAVVPILMAGMVLTGTTANLAFAFTVGAFFGGLAYCAVFVALAIVSRNAATIGLIYALLWESVLGNYAPGARAASIQQWAMSVTDSLTSAEYVHSTVNLPVAIVLLASVTVLGALLAADRLRTLSIASAD